MLVNSKFYSLKSQTSNFNKKINIYYSGPTYLYNFDYIKGSLLGFAKELCNMRLDLFSADVLLIMSILTVSIPIVFLLAVLVVAVLVLAILVLIVPVLTVTVLLKILVVRLNINIANSKTLELPKKKYILHALNSFKREGHR